MSDAQGSRNDSGEPIEGQDAGGDVQSAAQEPVAPESDPSTPIYDATAPVTPAEPTEAQAAPAEPASSDAAAAEPAADPVDYEALAAELDRLESDTATAAPVAPGAPEAPAADKSPWFEPAGRADAFQASDAPAAEPAPVAPPQVTASEPVVAPAAPAPVFVQAPEAPRRRGNRAAAGLIGLLAAVVFGGLFLGALLGVALVMAPAGGVDPVATILEIVSSAQFWVPVVVFWLTFWLFGVFVNRSRWWTWVVFGVLISAATWAGFLIAGVIGAPFWTVTIEEGLASVQGALLAVPGLIAFILSREITIWFGGWAASRGAKVTRQNKEALEEYERIMEEGPKAP